MIFFSVYFLFCFVSFFSLKEMRHIVLAAFPFTPRMNCILFSGLSNITFSWTWEISLFNSWI